MKSKFVQNLKGVVLGLLIAVGASYAIAGTWENAPSSGPTANNVAAPINVGGLDSGGTYNQTKTGVLTLNHLITPDIRVTNDDGTTSGLTEGKVLALVRDSNGAITGKAQWKNISELPGGNTGGTYNSFAGGKVVFRMSPSATIAADSGTITRGSNGISPNAKALLVEAYIDTNDSSTGTTNVSVDYKLGGSTAGWNHVLYVKNPYFGSFNSVWIPFDSTGRIDWRRSGVNKVSEYYFVIQAEQL